MGMLLTRVSFQGAPPTMEELERRLSIVTGINVHIEVVADDLPPNVHQTSRKQRHRNFHIHFSCPADNFKHVVWCGWWNDHELHINEPVDALNRCPNYPLFALVAVLIDLGGVSQMDGDLPAYARGSFENWKRLNHGTRPAIWKTTLATIGVISYACLFAVVTVVMLPFYLFRLPMFWLKTRKQMREFKRKMGRWE